MPDPLNRLISSWLAAAAIAVDDHDRDVAHVGRGGVAENRELHDRRHEDDAEDARVLAQLEDLLPHHEENASHTSIDASAALDASVSMTAAKMASAASCVQNVARPAPLSTMARSATMK